MNSLSGTELLSGVIAVVRADSAEAASTIARGLEGTPVDSVEITMTVPGAVEVVRDLSGELSLPVGMGTVTERAGVEGAVAAGARFIVSPGLQGEVVDAALEAAVPVVPGALTPSEIMTGWEAGATAVKVFPISAVGGSSYVRSVRAPLPHIPLIVSGGVRPEEVKEYLAAGALAVSLGGSLVGPEVAVQGADAVRRLARERLGPA